MADLEKLLSTDSKVEALQKINAIIENGGGGGLEICDIGTALYIDETKGKRRWLNGQIVAINDNTQAFLKRLKEIQLLHPSLFTTEGNWQAVKTLSAFGQVGLFVIDEEAGTIRIPAVVNIQGLFDLQNLGLTVQAGLPNIEGEFGTVRTHTNAAYAQGAFQSSGIDNSVLPAATGNVDDRLYVRFNASLSNPIYGNSDTVQEEAIQYPYFIQIATGSETKAEIINEIELNNPFSFGDSKYSPVALNNISWLKSEGQYNPKAVYTDYYDWLLRIYNGTEVVEGVSVKLVTEEYTDYDFVLNTADETFRLPLLDGSEDLPSDNIINLALPTATGQRYVAQYNGIVQCDATTSANNQFIQVANATSGQRFEVRNPLSGTSICGSVEVKKGDTIRVYADVISTIKTVSLLKAQGNGSLYFYVGETVQNAHLINAGRIQEHYTTKSMVDGQWVSCDHIIATPKAITSNTVFIDLSEIIPADGYDYIISGYWSTVRTDTGATDSKCSIYNENNCICLLNVDGVNQRSTLSFTTRLNATRTNLGYRVESYALNTSDIHLTGYRRMGTNV